MFGTALITGCSSGIGLYLAKEFAQHAHNLVLVAPVAEELRELASELSRDYGIHCRIFAKDLQKPEAPREIFDSLREEVSDIEILVNNAGHGFRGVSWELPIDTDLAMLRLNVEAVLRLTKLFLPPMLSRGHGHILNTASIAGFEPGPLLNVYHATKAFVLSWSEGLAIELQASGVKVTALCPGATDTDFFPKAGMTGVRAFQKGALMSPQEVAKAGYEALAKGEMIVVPGTMNKALVSARRILTQEAQARFNKAQYEEIPVENRKRLRGEIESAAELRA